MGIFVNAPFATAHANSAVITEAVNAYAAWCPPLGQRINNAYGFRAQLLLYGPPGYTNGNYWTDGSVWTADFLDPDVTPFSGQDSIGFDQPGNAIGFFSGHGNCDDQIPGTACNKTADCPDVIGRSKVCTRFSENPVAGKCEYSMPRTMYTAGNNPGANGCDPVNISTANMRYGESSTSGSWAAAGTNGNLNVAVLDISCGLTPDMVQQEYISAFAGITLINTIMPTRVGDDTFDTADRGWAFGAAYLASTSSSVGLAWANAINTTTGGSACPFGGGGHGINGCGANVAIARDTTFSAANWDLTSENWVQIRDESQDATGGGWITYVLTCNYNCSAHPWHL
jgi:hypothetical protein